MNNEEKKEYLIRWHQLVMKNHDATQVDLIPDQQAIGAYNSFLADFYKNLYPLQPKKFYRYRKFNENELDNLRNGTAWFSHPAKFNDSFDSAINIDLEAEIEEILGPNGDAKLKKDFTVSFVTYLLKEAGMYSNTELVLEAVEKAETRGFDDGMRSFFSKYLDEETANAFLTEVNRTLEANYTDKLRNEVLKRINIFQDVNKKVRASLYCLCLAEEPDNDSLWGEYADSCRGFAIEYSITPQTVLGSMILSNLLPIYYGKKPEIKLTDILRKGVFNPGDEMIVEGIAQSDYELIHISSYTKSIYWSLQREWRVVYGNSNVQPFPFATGIILGEEIEPEHREKILAVAREKGLSVIQRKLNRSGSKIVLEKIL